jgi:hypothetical protein
LKWNAGVAFAVPLLLVALTLTTFADDSPLFRTDSGEHQELPWYQIQSGEFPPEGSAHFISGELIRSDHIYRKVVLRVDRTDSQSRGDWDLPVASRLLPYSAIYYHGMPAALSDIPIGTHLHGLFYIKDEMDDSEPLPGWLAKWAGNVSNEADFRHCFRLEDDFSFYSRQKQRWLIKEVNQAGSTLTAALINDQSETIVSRKFHLRPDSTVWKAHGFGSQDDLSVGQEVQLNITRATLYGPGRIRDIWIDEESRRYATKRQLIRHQEHVRERGLAGWIDKVDNKKRVITVTFFDGVDSTLFNDLKDGEQARVAVATDLLITYDILSDSMQGPILSVKKVAKLQGSSGVQVAVKTGLLLEGFRPKRFVRIHPNVWPAIALPREEQMDNRD